MAKEQDIILKLDADEAALHELFYTSRIEELQAANNEDQKAADEIIVRINNRNEIISKYSNLLKTVRVQMHSGKRMVDAFTKSPVSNGDEFRAMDVGDYDETWSLAKKCEYVLKVKQKLLTTRQLIDGIFEYEPHYLEIKGIDFDRLQKNLGSTLLQKVNANNTFFRTKYEGEIEYLYGLITWL